MPDPNTAQGAGFSAAPLPVEDERYNVTQFNLARFPAGGERVANGERRPSLLWCFDAGAACDVALTDGRSLQIEGEALVLLPPGLGATVFSRHQPFRVARIHLRGWPAEVTAGAATDWPTLRPIQTGDILHSLMRYIGAHLEDAEPGRSQRIGPAVQLMLEAYRTGETSTTLIATQAAIPGNPVLGTAAQLLTEQALDPAVPSVRVSEIARGCAISRASLYRLFDSEIKLSPGACFRWIRLERAAELLLQSARPVKEVARDTGFTDPYYFSRFFRQTYGLSPTEFREDPDARSRMRGGVFERLQHARYAFNYGEGADQLLAAEPELVEAGEGGQVVRPYARADQRGPEAFRPLDLTAVLHRPLRGPDAWIQPGYEMPHLSLGPTTLHGVPMHIGSMASANPNAVALLQRPGGTVLPGASATLTIPVGEPVEAVYLLHGIAWVTEPILLGRYTFVLADGSEHPVDVHAASRFDPPPDDAWKGQALIQDWFTGDVRLANARSRPVGFGSGPHHEFSRRFLYTLEWVCPDKGATLEAIRLEVLEPKTMLMLLAATVLRPAKPTPKPTP